MQKKAFDVMEVAEGTWWGSGRQAAVGAVLKRRFKDILDYGAGFGSQFSFLKKHGERVHAYEPEISLQGKLRKQGYSSIYSTSEEALACSYDLIAMLDVIEHIENDREIAIKMFNALTPGGTIIVTSSAYQWLWSEHDVRNMHFRRYTAPQLRRLLEDAGFRVEHSGYWNAALLLPFAVSVFLGRKSEGGIQIPKALSYLIERWLRFEAFFIRFFPLPFGVSVIALGRRPL